MASKIVVIGDVDGNFRTVFHKISGLHAKNNFALAVVVGNLFARSEDTSASTSDDLQALVDGNIDVPLPTYFALGSRPLPPLVVQKLETTSDELCHNLFFLGRRTTMKTAEGIRIVTLGGQLQSNIAGGGSQNKYSPHYSEIDAKVLRGATTADILITSEWPEGIRNRSKVAFEPEVLPEARQCVADLDVVLKPRYHFSTSRNIYYEREPFFHPPSEDTDNLYPVTRFISMAAYGNTNKQKWIYAFSLEPSASHPVAPPPGSTACPLVLSEKKRAAPEHREQHLVYDDGNRGRRSNKRRKGEPQGPITEADCFFCLANENIATHLIASIGENSYLTTAKGPLPTSQTFPRLGFPGHMLIIPFTHKATLGAMTEEERHATYTEMQRYRVAMNEMLKSAAEAEYGSVTWEVSKASLPHTHWQYLPITADLISKGLVEAAFKALAENLHWPRFEKEDVGDGFEETSDFFRILIWNPNDDPKKQISYIMRFDEKIRFHNQFGREVLAKLLRLDKRIDWKECGQTQAEEENDVEKFKKAFADFDFAA
ncbi:hypothetical protein ACN47E_008703 [Coniothyrium glycines]